MSSWKEMLNKMLDNGETIIHCTLDDAAMAKNFSDGYGVHEGEPFCAWSEHRVFFPIVYDGSEWIGSAPRNPRSEGLEHQGGE